MRKQLAKGFAMLMLVMALAFMTAVVTANGQSMTTRANVPFDFIVGGQSLAAGSYTVSSITSAGDCLSVKNNSAKGTAVSLTTIASGDSKSGKLVFHRYGERYFLAEVWAYGGAQGRQLNKSRQERAIEKEHSRLAKLSGQSPRPTYETVEIAIATN